MAVIDNQITFTFEPFLWTFPQGRIREPKPHLYPMIVEAFQRIWSPEFLYDKCFNHAEVGIVDGEIQVVVTPTGDYSPNSGYEDSLIFGDYQNPVFTNNCVVVNGNSYIVSGEIQRDNLDNDSAYYEE